MTNRTECCKALDRLGACMLSAGISHGYWDAYETQAEGRAFALAYLDRPPARILESVEEEGAEAARLEREAGFSPGFILALIAEGYSHGYGIARARIEKGEPPHLPRFFETAEGWCWRSWVHGYFHGRAA